MLIPYRYQLLHRCRKALRAGFEMDRMALCKAALGLAPMLLSSVPNCRVRRRSEGHSSLEYYRTWSHEGNNISSVHQSENRRCDPDRSEMEMTSFAKNQATAMQLWLTLTLPSHFIIHLYFILEPPLIITSTQNSAPWRQ